MRLTSCNPVHNSQLAILQQRDTADSASDSPQLSDLLQNDYQVNCSKTQGFFSLRNYSEAKKSALIFSIFIYFRLFFYCLPDLSES